MNSFLTLLILTLALLPLCGCEGDPGPVAPSFSNEARLQIMNGPISIADNKWWDFGFRGVLMKFDKRNYPGANFISYAFRGHCSDTATTVTVRLYNRTDGVVIEGSEVTMKGTDTVTAESGNLIGKLPDRPIALSVQFTRKEGAGMGMIHAEGCYLFLYRN